jgi:hypothetical protein
VIKPANLQLLASSGVAVTLTPLQLADSHHLSGAAHDESAAVLAAVSFTVATDVAPLFLQGYQLQQGPMDHSYIRHGFRVDICIKALEERVISGDLVIKPANLQPLASSGVAATLTAPQLAVAPPQWGRGRRICCSSRSSFLRCHNSC